MAEGLSFPPSAVRIPPPPPSQTPLRSPKRRQQLPVDDDPLLGKLSPEAILDALAAINAVTKHERHAKDLLIRSISQVSPEDQALGARAALTAKRLREWLKEIQAWQWPKKPATQQGKGFVSPSADSTDDSTEFWGSLPARLVVEYEERLEEIRNGIDSLNVDELKEHIMNVHVPGRSRPSSSNSALSSISAPPFTYMQLSDFTAVITATILRALPTLARLHILLDTWSVRLLVLRQIPSLLDSLDTARASLDSALVSIQDSHQNKRRSIVDFTSKREELVQLISVTGSRMDKVLDALEGREDSIPDTWIDRMDALETDFTIWIQQIEKIAIEKVWSKAKEIERTDVKDGRPVEENQQTHDQTKNNNIEDSTLHTVDEKISSNSDGNTIVQNISSPLDDKNVPDMSSEGHILCNQDPISTLESESEGMPKLPPSVTDDAAVPEQITSVKSLPNSPILESILESPLATTEEIQGEKSNASEMQNTSEGVTDNNHRAEYTMPAEVEEVSPSLGPIEQSSSQDIEHQPSPDKEALELRPRKLVNDPPLLVPNDTKPDTTSNVQSKDEQDCVLSASNTTPKKRDLQSAETPQNTTHKSSPLQETEHFEVLKVRTPEKHHKSSESTSTAIHLDPETVLKSQDTTQTVSYSKDSEEDKLDRDHAQTGEELSNDISVLKSDPSAQSPSTHSHYEISRSDTTMQTQEVSTESSITESPPEKLITASQPSTSFEPSVNLNPDIPVQSIESSEEQYLPSVPLQSRNRIVSGQSRTSSIGTQSRDPSVPFSPGKFSSTSDRTIRELSSPQLSSSALQDLEKFKTSKNTSLPLQRFINDKSDANYSTNHAVHPASSHEDLTNTSQYSHEDVELSPFRHGESPPANVVPRRAIRGPSSSLMRGTISSLNKAVGTTKRHQSDSLSYQASSERLHSRSRLGSPYEVDSDSMSWHRKSSSNDLLRAPRHHLQNQPSMESISSYVSSNGTGDMRRRYSFSTDGGSFAIRPVNETDNELQEKIHSILTSIPGKIRLSDNPASDYDQHSVISMSSSKRGPIKSRSPFSTPSRAGTPTPSESLTPTSKQRRITSYKSEDKTVKVYHLHHRGKTEPTKLFVRTVGEDGGRVMVRVGGGWADLGEYLREYVLHHGHQKSLTSNVEVKGLPAMPTSPVSTTSAGTTVTAQNSPGAAPIISNRPSSSLSVHKLRRISKPLELPELAVDDAENTIDNPPLPPPTARRTSISSLSSVSVSSILGDGSSVYSPHPGSARGPHSHSTPLGLAGPKPRTRHVSMTPESEAWVEDVIGQARRTSSIVKPTQKPHDPRLDREAHNSSRMSMRSASDYTSVGRNKRVSLKGLGALE